MHLEGAGIGDAQGGRRVGRRIDRRDSRFAEAARFYQLRMTWLGCQVRKSGGWVGQVGSIVPTGEFARSFDRRHCHVFTVAHNGDELPILQDSFNTWQSPRRRDIEVHEPRMIARRAQRPRMKQAWRI